MKRMLVLLCVVAVALPALTQAAAPAKKSSGGGMSAAIEKADKDRSAAIVKGETDTVDKATADGYVFTDPDGRVTAKRELMEELKKGTLKLQSQQVSDVKVQMYGNTAVETGKVVTKGTRDGKDTSGTNRFTRVWVNHGGMWQTVAFQETKVP